MSEPNAGVCTPWVTEEEVKECQECSADEIEISEDILMASSNLLYILSGRQFAGSCSKVVRPCRRGLRFDGPVDQAVEGWNRTWGDCHCRFVPGRSNCTCGGISQLELGGWPVTAINHVWIDGSEVDPSEYRIDNFKFLVRVTEEGWPCCQDLRLDYLNPTLSPSFAVDFTFGMAPEASGKLAARRLACELALACSGSDSCRLPKRVQTISRQGVSMILLDPFQFLEHGKTGVYDIDLFLSAYNPNNLREEPVAISPDIGIPYVETTWESGS